MLCSTIGVVTYSESCFVLMFLVDGNPLWATLSVPMRNGDMAEIYYAADEYKRPTTIIIIIPAINALLGDRVVVWVARGRMN